MQYNQFVQKKRWLPLLLVLLAIAAAVIGPVLFAGYRNLALAEKSEATQRHADAAHLYESAGRLLVWQPGLWEKAGEAAYRAGDAHNAIRLFEIARRRGTFSASGWDMLATAYSSIGDQQSALSAWETGSLANATDTPLLDHLAAVYHKQASYAAEEATLTRRLAIRDDAAAHYRLGLLLMASQTAAAQDQLEAAASSDGTFRSVTATLIAALNASAVEPDAARRWVVLGRGFGLVDEWGLAGEVFARAVTVDPQNAEAWAWLGEAQQHGGGDGRSELDKALSLDPQDPIVHGLRGLYWKRQGDSSKALAEYLRAAQSDPKNPSLQASLGDAYVAAGDLVSALSSYQRATEAAPAESTYWRLLAMFCADNDVQIVDIGLPAAQKAAQLAPDDAQVLDALGWSYGQLGYLNAAEHTLEKAIRLEPGFALAHVHLGLTYLRAGDNASALDELKNARQLDADGPAGQLAAHLLARYFP